MSERSQIKATCHLLSDINEKIIAAIALKGIHNTYEKNVALLILAIFIIQICR